MKHCFTQWIKNLKMIVFDETPPENDWGTLYRVNKTRGMILGTKRMVLFQEKRYNEK